MWAYFIFIMLYPSTNVAMNTFWFVIFTCFLVANQASENSNSWSYLNEAKWTEKFCSEGKNQSPININTKTTKLARSEALHFNEKFSEKLKAKILNKDYTVVVYLDDASTRAEISGGGLNGSYAFIRFGFQWPSQHTINNKRFPLEINVVLYALKYGDARTAFNKKDGFVVLSAFFEISEQSNPVFDTLIDAVPKISANINGEPVPLQDRVILRDFLPNDGVYFKYFGSSTMPNCEEMVTFFVFQNPSKISPSQYFSLVNIKDDMNNTVLFNNRNIQDLNGRKIFRSA